METPSSGPSPTPESDPSAESLPERGDREVVSFLGNELLPALGDRAPRALRDAVRRAIRERRLTPLERLNGRLRHELLLAVEELAQTRRPPRPAVLVRLTTVISATPAAPERPGLSAVRPAR
jgi:hypothetical protein